MIWRSTGVRRVWIPLVGTAILGSGVAVTAVGTTHRSRPVAADTMVAIAGGNFQASGVQHVRGTRQFLFVDDDTPGNVYALEIAPTGIQRGAAIRVPLAARITDPEGMTWDGNYYYVVGSQSKLTGYDGDGLVRFTYDPATQRTSNVERIQGLKAWLAGHVSELRGADQHAGDHILNIEGLAWDPVGARLLLGLRAPVIDGQALIVPVRLDREDAGFTQDNLRVAGETIRLPLDGAGIRSIEYDEPSSRFRIITGAELNEETLDFLVMEWDGRSGTKPITTGRYDRRVKPEGFTTAADETGIQRVMVFDTGLLIVTK
jgi:hypothetical protein